MNKLQIAEDIFGSMCFCPHLEVRGQNEYLSARNKQSHFSAWPPVFLDIWQRKALMHGYRIGIDFINEEFTLHKIENL